MSFVTRIRWAAAATVLASGATLAQQAQPPTWEKMPRMQLEQQFAGPLQDTVIQRWRDPSAGTVCYMYLPIVAAHTPPTAAGYVQYGPNAIGSISCFEPGQVTASAPKTLPAKPAARPPGARAPATPPVPPPG
jgi:hypothetical protein